MKPTQLASIALLLTILAGCSPAVQPPVFDPSVSSPVELDHDSEQFFEESQHLFDYDPAEPLDIQVTGGGRTSGVTAYDFTYASRRDGRVPATLLVPDGAGPYPSGSP